MEYWEKKHKLIASFACFQMISLLNDTEKAKIDLILNCK